MSTRVRGNVWLDGDNIVPRTEYEVFHQLIESAVILNTAILAMVKRYPFLFGTQDKASINHYIKSMEQITRNLPR